MPDSNEIASPTRRTPFDQLALWSALFIILLFTYAKFFVTPFSGFTFQSDGVVAFVNASANPEAAVEVGDQLVKIGDVAWADFERNLQQPMFPGARAGQAIPITVIRGDRTLTLPWVFPGPTPREWQGRIVSDWFLPFVFWLAAAATVYLLRPRDRRWWLLLAFNLLTALWLAFGGRTSAFHVWGAAVLLRAAVWLSVPVYLHLHWIFPRPLGRVPTWAGRLLYGVAGLLAVAHIFQIVPASTYLLGFLAMVAGSALLLLAHFGLRRAERREIGLVFGALFLALLPSIAVGVASVIGPPPAFSSAALLAFILLPFAYLYVAFRRRLGWLEVRANRVIAVVLYLVLIASVLTIGLAAVMAVTHMESEPVFFSLFVALVTALLTMVWLEPFQRFVERRLLGMPVPPNHLLTTYSPHISTSPDSAHLVRTLRDEVLPTLLVRQSALLRLDGGHAPTVLYVEGVAPEDVPSQAPLAGLLAQPGRYRPPETQSASDWARLALPLDIGPKRLGVWLLGRRDPDDYYAASEISVLNLLASQAAVALANIEQTGRLHALYQDDIDRTELERGRLARELHDGVLNHLATIALLHDTDQMPAGVRENYAAMDVSLRDTIANLRPAMLNYGLGPGLEGLVSQLQNRGGEGPSIALQITASEARLPEQVELHLYRIVQQAAENAIRHAQAGQVNISGQVLAERVHLKVVDDGHGFEAEAGLDLPAMLAQGHNGLVGMFERADLIGATLTVCSGPGRGATIEVVWQPPSA